MAEAERIDGRAAAARIIDKVKTATASFSAGTGIQPGLAVVIVGEDPASQVYVGSKARMALECGFRSDKHVLDAQTSQAELLATIEALNTDPGIHGILVQLPLPPQIDDNKVIQAISAEKDVDGFHLVNVGRLSTGNLAEAFVPCTPAGSMILIRDVLGADLSGRHAVVVGRSNIVGKPMAQLLLSANATVTIAHSRTKDLAALCRQADILVAAVGRPRMIDADYIKPGAVVIDVGINRIEQPATKADDGSLPKTKLVGDIDTAAAARKARAITPVPGGVGPMTIAMLMANTLIAACRAAGHPAPEL